MIKRDIIVVGASAGGVRALTEFVKSLPKKFSGSIFIVLHTPPHSTSNMPAILTRAGLLPATHAIDGEPIIPGHIYVAPPDHHMLLEANCILVQKGPEENRFRPSIDALFRSAAYVYGPRVVGIVLSGLLNDGTSGLWSIKRLGGLTIIQEPADADYPNMPVNARESVSIDYVAPAMKMGALLERITLKKANKKPKISVKEMKLLEMEVMIAKQGNAFALGIMEAGELTPFTCPECHGVLVKLTAGKIIRFRCHTGHAYTASALLADGTKHIEEFLWQAMRGLEETTLLLKQISQHFNKQGDKDVAIFFNGKAEATAKKARVIRDSVFTQELLSEDLRHDKVAIKQIKGKAARKKNTNSHLAKSKRSVNLNIK